MNYFVKACVEKKNCNKDDGCKPAAQRLGMKFKDCDFNCCETDLCNGSTDGQQLLVLGMRSSS